MEGQKNNIIDAVGKFDIVKGMYVLSNGVEFETIAEVKAFIKGLEYGKANANIGLDVAIENAVHSLKDVEY